MFPWLLMNTERAEKQRVLKGSTPTPPFRRSRTPGMRLWPGFLASQFYAAAQILLVFAIDARIDWTLLIRYHKAAEQILTFFILSVIPVIMGAVAAYFWPELPVTRRHSAVAANLLFTCLWGTLFIYLDVTQGMNDVSDISIIFVFLLMLAPLWFLFMIVGLNFGFRLWNNARLL